MITRPQIVRKAFAAATLLIVLAAASIFFATDASAQSYEPGMASSPYSGATPNAMNVVTGNPPEFGPYGAPTPPTGASSPSVTVPNASLLAVPVVGTAPLTVDFYVGSANTPGSLLDEWIFGDGAELFLPAQPFMLHVYQHPGIYTCELGLINAQGMTTTVFARITVKADD
jgi:PKD repeat protein